MTSKTRRAPLFGIDNPLRLPTLPKYSTAQTTTFKKCVTAPAAPTPPISAKTSNSAQALIMASKNHSRPAPIMEGGLAAYAGGPVQAGTRSPDRHRTGSPKSLHVGFAQVGEVKERKEKYLTAKYGAHQMALIRKRLGVEMWMYDQLQTLYTNTKDGKTSEKEVDLDELLDFENESERRKDLTKTLKDCTQTKDKIDKFVDELLERVKTL